MWAPCSMDSSQRKSNSGAVRRSSLWVSSERRKPLARLRPARTSSFSATPPRLLTIDLGELEVRGGFDGGYRYHAGEAGVLYFTSQKLHEQLLDKAVDAFNAISHGAPL